VDVFERCAVEFIICKPGAVELTIGPGNDVTPAKEVFFDIPVWFMTMLMPSELVPLLIGDVLKLRFNGR
jgi:hypothetical protein